MRIRARWSVLGLLFGLVTQTAQAECKVALVADLPVTMRGFTPLVSIKINGTPTHLVVDSGAFMSLLSPGTAAELQLKLRHDFHHRGITGVGGQTSAVHVTEVSNLELGGMTVHDAQFVVAGNEYGYDVAGLLGQNLWANFDVEYDLGNGHIRLMKPLDCGDQPLAYWAAQSGQSPSSLKILPAKVYAHTIGEAEVNGFKLYALFDTGATGSIISLAAAARAGVHPTDPGVRSGGSGLGVAGGYVSSWIAPFASFKIGGEEIRNTHLRIGDAGGNSDILIGADFFLSHRIYVSNQQQRLYFTYNGGQVFNLSTTPIRVADASVAGTEADGKTEPAAAQSDTAKSAVPIASDATADAASAPPGPTGDAPQEAAAASQHGMVLAARREFTQALAELDRACQLAPTEPAYRVQRARLHLELRQAKLAQKDFDSALVSQPDDLEALLGRAELRANQHDKQGARTDLDAAVQASSTQSDARFNIAMLYQRIDEVELAAAQLDQWIAAHPRDAKRATAFGERCWNRALLGQDLPKALDDCSKALRLERQSAAALNGRGLIRLRMGEYKSSIEDYDAALTQQPKIAWSLYGRGLDRLHIGQTERGQADIAAAVALVSDIATRLERFGIVPAPATSASP